MNKLKIGNIKERQSHSFFKRRMYKNTLFTLVYAVVTAIVGMFIMSFLYDIKINFIYGAILAGWLFLITFLFLLVK